jgi:DNA (cytosine-5)-methyltransferase 1
MKWMVGEFEDLGYRWAYRVLDTMGFGLPQRRRRVYFVASLDVDPRSVLFAENQPPRAVSPPTLDKPLGVYWTEGRSGIGLTVDGIPPLKVGSSVGIPSAPAVLFPDGEVLMPSLTACERLQGFAPGWTDVHAFVSLKRNPRWRLVGNAVSVPAAQWVAERIKSPSDEIADFEPTSLEQAHRWSDAAWNVGQGRVNVIASDQPRTLTRPSIARFRDGDWTRLSERALTGFVTRTIGGGLRVPEGFLDALRVAVRKQPAARHIASFPVALRSGAAAGKI